MAAVVDFEMAPFKAPTSAIALVHHPQTQSLSLENLPLPDVATENDEHLIRVHAVALTNGELSWPEPLAQTHPIPGYEVAGTVEIAPPHSPFQRGAKVYARTDFGRPGSARQFSVALTSELGRKPRNISWEEAATVPLSALTAWQALFTHGGLDEPMVLGVKSANSLKRVLVTAAAGGVGIFAVQLAKLAGAEVVGTAGPANQGFLKELGADETLDYTKTDISDWVVQSRSRQFDLVIDCVGGSTLTSAWKCVRDGGMIISIASPAEACRPKEGTLNTIRSAWFIVGANNEQLEKLPVLIEEGKCKVVVDTAFALEDYQRAFSKAQGGHVRGKIVLSIPQEG
jgi:NADPH:quinone reductase-like Zn-dependent oxidoreductase